MPIVNRVKIRFTIGIFNCCSFSTYLSDLIDGPSQINSKLKEVFPMQNQ